MSHFLFIANEMYNLNSIVFVPSFNSNLIYALSKKVLKYLESNLLTHYFFVTTKNKKGIFSDF